MSGVFGLSQSMSNEWFVFSGVGGREAGGGVLHGDTRHATGNTPVRRPSSLTSTHVVVSLVLRRVHGSGTDSRRGEGAYI